MHSVTLSSLLFYPEVCPGLHWAHPYHVHCRQGICSLCGFKSMRFRHNSLHSTKLYTLHFPRKLKIYAFFFFFYPKEKFWTLHLFVFKSV